MSGIIEDIKAINTVFDLFPTDAIRDLEDEVPKVRDGRTGIRRYLSERSISKNVLDSAMRLKEMVGQINVVIHALGVLVSLPYILDEDETIEAISLGAGNTGKRFDLVTNRRVAEFKFISWRGGSESIRQNSVFKDFLNLLWDSSGKRRQLFLNGKEEAVSFLNRGRSINSVLSKNATVAKKFESLYGKEYRTVGEFYSLHKNEVEVVDLNTLFPVSEYINTI